MQGIRGGRISDQTRQQSALLNAIVTAMDGPQASAVTHSPVHIADRHERRTSFHVLLADDNVVNQKLALRILEKRHCTVETASTGTAVLQALEKRSFDVILMDVQMPEMDGFEATAAIREKEKSTGKHVPIIAVTAHALKGDRERCLAGGMDEYISKPIDAKELFAVIERLVPYPVESRAQSEVSKSGASKLERSEAVLDEVYLRDKTDNDEQLLQELIELFRLDCPRMLKQIDDAITAEDPRALELAAHALKGAIGTFAAQPSFEAALRLEMMGREHQIIEAGRAYKILETEIDRLQATLAAITIKKSARAGAQ